MLTKLKQRTQQMLSTEAKIVHKIGFTPNRLSILGFILSITSAVAYGLASPEAVWLLLLATFLMLSSGFCDTLDGIVARIYGEATVFGGFFDSVLDRYSDAIIYMAILVSGLSNYALGAFWGTILVLVTLTGSLLVSYTRARAEAAGIKMESIGFAERAERMIILSVVSIMAYFWLPAMGYGIGLLAILSTLTVIQRSLYVYRKLKKEKHQE
ncbi:MAG: CDP-alcohol phosphatidyltransferase family protein [Candidatus Bathyarchaeota archaeon]|nr:CDP-alcohol phosphatidyltransferase family protein [Candidatus Bathyarchaeota archaeon]